MSWNWLYITRLDNSRNRKSPINSGEEPQIRMMLKNGLIMEEFIHRHKDDGVLLLKATYKIQLTEIAKLSKKVISSPLPLEKEKIIEKK